MGKIAVAPLVGAWIEIIVRDICSDSCEVAPLVGAWIEIATILKSRTARCRSLPLWERGLKYMETSKHSTSHVVAPLVGAWIEICTVRSKTSYYCSRSPCGSVD